MTEQEKSANDLSAALLQEQQRRAIQPEKSDDLLVLSEKRCKAAGVPFPTSVSTFNTECMSNVFVWPLLLSRDRGLATLALQGHINSTFCGSPPHIIEQVLQLIQSLSLAAD